MKIELKNIKYNASLSEETSAFTADVYINNIRAAYVQNRGDGGANTIFPFKDDGWKILKDAEAYCKTLPTFTIPTSNGVPGPNVEMGLDLFIDRALNDYLQKRDQLKFQKQIDKAMVSAIVVGVPNDQYRRLRFKMPLSELLKEPDGNGKRIILYTLQNDLKEYLDKGELILNTNIPVEILKRAGLTGNQYITKEVA